MTPAAFEEANSEFARLILAAAAFAEQILLKAGAAPATPDDLLMLRDDFNEQCLEELRADVSNPTADDVEAIRENACYALGVAVGLRLAGGAR